MKLQAMLLIFIVLLFAAGRAQSQGSRGSMGAASGSPAQGGSMSRSGFPSSQRFQTFSAPNFSPRSQSLPSRRAGSVFIQPQVEHRRSSFAIIGPSHFRRRIPSVAFARPPFIHHRHRHFFIPSSTVFIEVPRFAGSTVTGPFFSTYGWTEQRLVEVPTGDPRVRASGQWAPFDPTPHEVVERMLAVAAVKQSDVIYDLGSGDGRVLIAAAKKYGAKAVGFEIDPGLVKLARENVRREDVEKLVEIRHQDFMTADLSPATVVTLYLSYDGNLAVRPKLTRELKPGARVVSYAFDMGDWQPKVVESYRDAAGDTHLLYLWQISDPQSYSRNSSRAAE